MAARPLWSGSISFGLVSISVRMFAATQSRELRFHFVDRRDLMPVGYDKVRKDTGEHVDPDEIVRAFEIEKGHYVPLEPDDLDRLDVELAHAIDILDFVLLEEIDPIYFRQAYYLLPQQGGEKPYRLLEQALEETGRVGVAKVVIRNKQHLACLRTFEGVLLIETMYYADEVRRPESLDDDRAWRDVDVRPAGRARDGQVARREPQRGIRPGQVRRHLSQGAPRPDPVEGRRCPAARAAT